MDYYTGRKAAKSGEQFDPNQSQDWQIGWFHETSTQWHIEWDKTDPSLPKRDTRSTYYWLPSQ